MKPTLLFLTCSNTEETKSIIDTLLDQQLVACVKLLPITSHFLWKGKKESEVEILLIMETIEENYESIHDQVKKLHSYETFILQAVPINKMSKQAQQWLNESLKI